MRDRARRHAVLAFFTVLTLLSFPAACGRSAAPTRPIEVLLYLGGSGELALDSFRAHADQISVVAPQAFRVDSAGAVTGGVHPEVLTIAREHGVRVVPLIVNPGFNQPIIHALLHDPAARARTVEAMVTLAEEHGFDGWQFDFENIDASDRDAFTDFFLEAAEALHARGLEISVAVVPTGGGEGETPFQRYMQANWRGNFDIAALAAAGDFISLMTYAQHGGITTPGPIAGLPWIGRMLDYALARGVPPEKISLGLPGYSGYWLPFYDEERGGRVAGREISHRRAMELLGEAGVEPTWLPEQGVSVASWENRGLFEWLFLEDRRSLTAKLDLFGSRAGLRGISMWVLGAEDPEFWDLLAARYEASRGTVSAPRDAADP